MEFAGDLAVCFVGGDEAGESVGRGVGEEFGDLCVFLVLAWPGSGEANVPQRFF
jgi:hypothetical protein